MSGTATGMRRFRSLLYAAGDDPATIEHAADSAADALIFDLEDRVAIDRKDIARTTVRSAVEALAHHRTCYVRVNALDSGLIREDLAAVAVPGLDGIRVPKIDSVESVRELDALLTDAEAAARLAPGSVRLSLGLESAAAVRLTFELCLASARVTSVAPGLGVGGDLQRDLGFEPTETADETLYLRSKVVLDARAAGVPIPLDGGYGTYRAYDPAREEAAFIRSAELGRRLGYRAKICFHAEQADRINTIFADAREDS